MNQRTAVVLQEISKSFHGKPVLQGFSASFGPHIYVLTGANGSGKTTILNMIAGIIAPDGGSISINGRSVRDQKETIFLAPASTPAISWLTGNEFISFVANLYRQTSHNEQFRKYVVDKLGLAGSMDKPLSALSAGTGKKVLLTSALVANPQIVLFDEPTNELDRESVQAFIAILKEEAIGKTVIIATHLVDGFAGLHAKNIALAQDVAESEPRAARQ